MYVEIGVFILLVFAVFTEYKINKSIKQAKVNEEKLNNLHREIAAIVKIQKEILRETVKRNT